MSEQKVWKLTKTDYREIAIREINNFVKEDNFSKLMDIGFKLALQRLKEKDEFRRQSHENITAFMFTPEDFVWNG